MTRGYLGPPRHTSYLFEKTKPDSHSSSFFFSDRRNNLLDHLLIPLLRPIRSNSLPTVANHFIFTNLDWCFKQILGAKSHPFERQDFPHVSLISSSLSVSRALCQISFTPQNNSECKHIALPVFKG